MNYRRPAKPVVESPIAAFAAAFAAVALLTFIPATAAQKNRVIVNQLAIAYAQELIEQGKFAADEKGAWREHQVSTDEENKFIRAHGFTEYAKWHLALDEIHAPDTKARYKFPYGDFEIVHRSALLAIRQRARQYGYFEVENAAGRLLELLAAKNDSTQPRR